MAEQTPRPRLIGLSGGIGSGKSTVATIWAQQFSTPIADADQISRQLTGAGGEAIPAITRQFGAGLVDADGAMDRAEMRRRVFQDATAKQKLEAILHPLIFGAIDRQIDQARAQGRGAVVLDIPLLVESRHWRTRLDQIVIVDCPRHLQIERVMARSQLGAEEVERIIAHQASRAARLDAADLVVHNGAITLAQLQAQATAAGRLLGLGERV